MFTTLDNAIAACRNAEKAFIIGGAQIYSQAVATADRLLLTRFDRTAAGADCFFPAISPDSWLTVDRSDWMTDEKSGVRYRFETLERTK